MQEPKYIPTVKLVGTDGNAFAIMGRVIKALQKAGADKEYTNKYMNEAMSGDYDHLLGVSMEYIDVV
jgi:hypothetical protein